MDPVRQDLIHVLVGLLVDERGRYLINQRQAGTHMAGSWEFPGGKRGGNEARHDALARELVEELGIRVIAAEPMLAFRHDYPDRSVQLDVWRVLDYAGRPYSREGQLLRWVPLGELEEVDLLAADRPIIDALLAGAAR